MSLRFRPRSLDALRGYDQTRLAHDLGAGLTVAVVALPLAMAFAIASGLTPQAGLWTAIIGGFLVSLLGGSSVQIAGPAGAFIVIVYGIVERHGVANLLICTAGAGVILFILGLLRLGTLVRYVPVSIVIGFTNGIAVLIALSQLRDWLGLDLAKLPADFFLQLHALWTHRHTINPHAVVLGSLCMGGLWLWPRLWGSAAPLPGTVDSPGLKRAAQVGARIPGPVVALVTLSLLAGLLQWPVETIGSRFGSIPQGLPTWSLPAASWDTARQLVTPTLTIALLGAIESLLCARVADQISNLPKHDPNQELMAQGIANAVVPWVGGMPVTGTIARTVTNVRSGANSPVAGMVHALGLLAVVLAAAPLALHVPLAVLAGILLFVAWNMGEWREFTRLRQFSNHYRLLMLSTFTLTILFDLTVAVEVGLVLACVLFVRRMGTLFRIEAVPQAQADATTLRFRLSGALFFGAVAEVDRLADQLRSETGPGLQGVTVVLDAGALVALDTSGVDALRDLHRVVAARGGHLRLEQLQEQPASLVTRSGLAAELASGSASTGH